MDLKNIALEMRLVGKRDFVRFKLVYYENIAVVDLVNAVVYKKTTSSAEAQKHLTTLVDMYCAFLNADRGIKNSVPVCFKRIFYRLTAFVKNYIHTYHLPFILSKYKKICNKKNKIYKEIAKNK